MLDKGGYLVYNGNPVDAVVYFKKCIESIDADDRECDVCGYVNPEQIFSIVEAKVVDEWD